MTEITYQGYSDKQPLQQTSEQMLIMQQAQEIVKMQQVIMSQASLIAHIQKGGANK